MIPSKKRKKIRYVPRLTGQDIEDIVGILESWAGKLTWELLIDELLRRWNRRYTRQALDRHSFVKRAFFGAKLRLRKSPANLKRQGPIELWKTRERIKRLEAELDRVKGENNRLVEKFLRWSSNAFAAGMSEAELEKPLPPGIDWRVRKSLYESVRSSPSSHRVFAP